MNYEVIVRPEAESDIADTHDWYEAQLEGLGERFLASLDNTIRSIQTQPSAYPIVHNQIRPALLKKYPYNVFYLVESDRVIVLACFHVRRNPKSWPL
jgi:plasmid stabilization system protein ParE